MKLMIDTNIILDVLLQREEFYRPAAEIMRKCNADVYTGYITANSVCDIFYIARKYIHDKDKLYQIMESICGIFTLCDVIPTDITLALAERATDFEDCVLAKCAERLGCDCIVTRNGKDFKEFGIMTNTPEQLLQSQK